jgi:hypothetical protein
MIFITTFDQTDGFSLNFCVNINSTGTLTYFAFYNPQYDTMTE